MPVLTVFSASVHENQKGNDNTVLQDTATIYRDGIWEGKSQASYTDEPYWGIARLTIKDGKLADIFFMIRDSSLHETFNAKYEKHFEGNPEYIQQTRNDWKGVQTYPEKFLKEKNIKKVDAITGATWSYDIFRASVEAALSKAVQD